MCAAAMVLSACQCDVRIRNGVNATISVTPNPVVVPRTIVGQGAAVVLQVSNKSAFSALKLTATPELIPDSPTAPGVFSLESVLTSDCEARERSGDLLEIAMAGCATLTVHYTPQSVGTDSATLRFLTNDPKNPIYDVPIQATAASIQVQVCVDEAGNERCNEPGQPLLVGWTDPNNIGVPETRSLRLKSLGSTDVNVETLSFSGDPAFSMTPGAADFAPLALAPASTWPFTVSLTRPDGKPRQAALVFKTDDPANPQVTVSLTATGGAALCWCVGSESTPCMPVTVADFGEVDISAVGRKYLELRSCGSVPLTFVKLTAPVDAPVAITGDPAFEAEVASLPTAGWAVEPDSTPIRVPLEFRPVVEQTYAGLLEINTDVRTVTVPLTGSGLIGCALTGPALIDFGPLEANHEAARSLVLTNEGHRACSFPTDATISMGAGVVYRIDGTLPLTLAPGDSTTLTVTYKPEDATGPDLGEVSVFSLDDVPDAALQTLTVRLTGAPLAALLCKLQALPVLSPVGNSFDFGSIQVGQRVQKKIQLKNAGNGPCTLANLRLNRGNSAGSSAFTLVTTSAPPTLAPFATFDIDIAFAPTTLGAYGPMLADWSDATRLQLDTSDLLTFSGQACAQVNGADAPQGCAGWTLFGTGVGTTQLDVRPGRLDFGNVKLGCHARQQSVSLYNTSNAAFRVTDYYLDPLGSPPPFSVTGPATPFQINAGGHVDLVVHYTPTVAAQETTTLFIKTDLRPGVPEPDALVEIVGTGTASSHHEDTFNMGPVVKADLLFVVDNSGSMALEFQHMSRNLAMFVDIADAVEADFHMAVITTDALAPSQSGRFQGSPTIISTSTQAASLLSGNILGLGNTGSGEEHGFQAVVQALSEPLVSDPRANSGFLRNDAWLDIIVIGDEDDQSPQTLDYYETFFKSLKGPGRGSLVTFNAIAGPPTFGCMSMVGGAVYGRRYAEMQQRTGGRFRSICDQEWGRLAYELHGVGTDGPRSRFALTNPCDPATIKVHLGGTPISPSLYTYEAASNSVILSASARPAPGTTVIIEYDEICL